MTYRFYADRLSTGFMLQLYVDRNQLAIVLGRLRLTWVRGCGTLGAGG